MSLLTGLMQFCFNLISRVFRIFQLIYTNQIVFLEGKLKFNDFNRCHLCAGIQLVIRKHVHIFTWNCEVNLVWNNLADLRALPKLNEDDSSDVFL